MGQILNNRLLDTPLVPGAGFSFSISGLSTPSDVSARFGVSNIIHKTAGGVAVLPEANTTLPSAVLETPERRRPITLTATRSASGVDLRFTGFGDQVRGIYEVTSEVDSYAPVMAQISIRVRPSTWTLEAAPYWAGANVDLAPVYFGLEYGVRNTGLFVFLAENGYVYSGGPLRDYTQTGRSGTDLAAFGWNTLPDDSVITLYIIAYGSSFTLLGSGPGIPITVLRTGALGDLNTFRTPESGFSQNRSGPSTQARLFFGCTSTQDHVDFTDFGLFPYFPKAIEEGEPQVDHIVRLKPNAPHLFFSADRLLPTDPTIGWKKDGTVLPSVSFGYQPGRPSTPFASNIIRSAPGTSFLAREEDLQPSCYLEAWMSGEVTNLGSIATGIGLHIRYSDRSYKVVAVDAGALRTYGIVKDEDALESLEEGYWLPTDINNEVRQFDYTAPRLVRLSIHATTATAELFIEDLNTPVLSVPLALFPVAPTVPQEYFAIGHVSVSGASSGIARMSAVSYSAITVCDWRAGADPDLDGLQADTYGTATITVPSSGSLLIDKTSHGTDNGSRAVLGLDHQALYRQGFQVEFRTKVLSYSDLLGNLNAPKQWTGVGIRVTFPVSELPETVELVVGFFDCGFFGRKVGFLHGGVTVADIVNQTAAGVSNSATMAWGAMSDYRLVYLPGDSIRLYGPGSIKNSVLISLPWARYLPKQDAYPVRPSFEFGNFNSLNAAQSEWEVFRVQVSGGQDFAITPLMHHEAKDWAFAGRSMLLLDVADSASRHLSSVSYCTLASTADLLVPAAPEILSVASGSKLEQSYPMVPDTGTTDVYVIGAHFAGATLVEVYTIAGSPGYPFNTSVTFTPNSGSEDTELYFPLSDVSTAYQTEFPPDSPGPTDLFEVRITTPLGVVESTGFGFHIEGV